MSGWGEGAHGASSYPLTLDDATVARIARGLLSNPAHPIAARLIGERDRGLRVWLGLALIDVSSWPLFEKVWRRPAPARPARLQLIDDQFGVWLACDACENWFLPANDPGMGARFAAHLTLCSATTRGGRA